MTEEEFKVVVKKQEVPIEALYEYYIETSKIPIAIHDFEKILFVMVSNRSEVKGSDGNMKRVTYTSVINRFYDYYKRKFNLWT